MARNSRDAYGFGLGGPNPALAPTPIISTRAPVAGDINFEVGTTWISTTTGQAWTMTQSIAGAATWSLSSPGASDVDTVNGLSPVAGNIIIDGGTNLTDAAAGNTVTMNMDAAITLATSVTSPLYTAAAALDITAPAGSNITLQMGDNAGANIVEFEDSASAAVATMDSNGTLTVVNMDGIIGATTPAAGTFTTVAGNTSVSSILFTSIGATDTLITAQAGEDIVLRMGDAAGANFVRFQSSTPADVVTMDSTGVLSALAGLNVAGAFAQTAGQFDVGQDNAANAINIGGGTTARAIGIANSAAAHTTTIGTVTGASSLDLLAGTGNFTLEGNVATTYAISNTGVNTGQVDIAGGTGARTINIGGGGTGAKTIGIGAAASADIITIGDATGAGSLDLVCGTGNFTLEGNVATTYAISNTGVNTGQVDIAGGTGARTINIGGGGTGAKTIGIGAAASADVITIGDATGAGSLDLVCGTGNFTLEGNVATTYDISNTGVNTGAVNIAGGTGARTITIGGGGTGAKTINIGAAASADLITIGDATGAGSLDLVCGTGNFTLEGNVATTYQISNVGVNTGQVDIAGGTGARTINVGGGGTGAKTINIGAAASADLITIGDATGAGSLDLVCGTGNFTLEGNVATTYAISNTGVNTGQVDIAGGTGARTINLGGGGTGAKTINIGAAASADVITIGDATGAGSLTLVAGTGEIVVTGTVKSITSEFTSRSGDWIPAIQSNPVMTTAANTGGAPTGATGDVNLMSLQEGVIMEQFIVGAGQTIIAPRMDANGLLISLDITGTEGAEYNWGAARNGSRHAFTIGTSDAFFFTVGLYINDMDGADPYVIGFRRVAANNAVMANYTDYATIGMNAASSIVNVVTITELNGAGQTITDTTDAWGGDGSTNVLSVLVSAAGVVTYTINGAAPSVPAAFTFDNGDIVVPFIRVVHDAANPTQVDITSIQCGFQA